jgi:hypothetical protein
MGEEALVLESESGTLRVVPQNDGWCAVTLSLAGSDHRLGADAPKVVLMKLAAGLADELRGKEIGKIRGLPVRAIMSLFEDHCTIYATNEGDDRLWIVQRPDASLLGTVRLSREDRVRWLASVEAALSAQAAQAPQGR